jgi:hypothetical protein
MSEKQKRFIYPRPLEQGIVEVEGQLLEDGDFLYNPEGHEHDEIVKFGHHSETLEEAIPVWDSLRRQEVQSWKDSAAFWEREDNLTPVVTRLGDGT